MAFAGCSLPAHTGSRAGSRLFQSCALGKSLGHALKMCIRDRDCTAACLLTSDLFGFAARMDDSQAMGKYGGVAFAFVCRR